MREHPTPADWHAEKPATATKWEVSVTELKFQSAAWYSHNLCIISRSLSIIKAAVRSVGIARFDIEMEMEPPFEHGTASKS